MKENNMLSDNQRIISVCENLISHGFARSLSAIAKDLGKTAQYFTDLKRGKAVYSRDFLESLVDAYPVNRKYVLHGEGDMLLKDPHGVPAKSESPLHTQTETVTMPREVFEQLTKMTDAVLYRKGAEDEIKDMHREMRAMRKELMDAVAAQNIEIENLSKKTAEGANSAALREAHG